ncbi:MAG: hypothetical protein IT281_08855 [Ignavibacteria bacterium]|nr:hypothetical protein [Ignavibacteria bacterium]MCC7159634.1 hypothetical protein [Ignavibacteria bacterium]
MRKYITSFLLVFALFTINGAEFLHHHDQDSENDESKCEACIFNHSLKTALVEQVFVFTPQLFTYQSISNFVNPVPQSDCLIASPGRAPPVVSHI